MKMCTGIGFDVNGAVGYRRFEKEDFTYIVRALESAVESGIIPDINLLEKFRYLKDCCNKKDDRSATMVIHEPVEYDYD